MTEDMMPSDPADDTIEERAPESASRELAPFSTPATSMLDVIARASTDPRCDVGKMQALLNMQRELIADQARAEFNEAMARLQPDLPRIPKRGVVDRGPGKGRFPYGKWEDIDALIRPLLTREGFSLSYNTEQRDGGIIVTGSLRHRAGHVETASLGPLPADTSGGKNPVQALGSTAAYGKRYTTTMLLNLTFEGEDDDGQGGEDEFITEQQGRDIARLLQETDSNVERFLHHMKVHETSALRQSQYQHAIGMLKSKKDRQQRESQDARS